MTELYQKAIDRILLAASILKQNSSDQLAVRILGLLFLKWIYDHSADQETSDQKINIPPQTNWDSMLKTNPTEFLKKLEDSIRYLEKENSGLQNLFTKGDIFTSLYRQSEHPQTLGIFHFAHTISDIFNEYPFLKSRSDLSTVFIGLIHRLALDQGRFGAEFSTPPSLKRLMIELVQPKPGEQVYDPVCGTAGFLVESHRQTFPETLKTKVYGRDISSTAVALATMNLFLAGADYKINQSNSFDSAPWLDASGKVISFDVIVANPPFSRHIHKEELWQLTTNGDYLPETNRLSNMDYAFLQYIAVNLSKHGRAAMIAPLGILFRKGAEQLIRQHMVEADFFDAIIKLPSNLFYGTVIPACIVLLRKTKKMDRQGKVLLIDASNLAVEPGRIKSLSNDTIQQINNLYHDFKEVKSLARVIALDEIRTSEYDLSVNRHMTYVRQKYRPVSEIMDELKKLQDEQNVLCQQLMQAVSTITNIL